MNKSIGIAALAGLVGAALVLAYDAGRARANGIPQTNALTYTGTLLEYGTAASGTHAMTANLYVSGSTTAACSVSSSSVAVVNGQFTLNLPAACVTVIHQNPNVEIEITVDGTALGTTSLNAVPYAVEADTASNAAPGSALGSLAPPGTIIAYGGIIGGSGNVAVPSGWLLCNGQAVSRTTYAALFAAVQTTAGAGDGQATFNVPDYRGYFLRGLDDGTTGRDTSLATRTAMATGGATGDGVNTVEANTLGTHTHSITDPGHGHNAGSPGGCMYDFNGSGPPGGGGVTNGGGTDTGCGYIQASTTGITVNAAGSAETRPLNAAVNYLIKY